MVRSKKPFPKILTQIQSLILDLEFSLENFYQAHKIKRQDYEKKLKRLDRIKKAIQGLERDYKNKTSPPLETELAFFIDFLEKRTEEEKKDILFFLNKKRSILKKILSMNEKAIFLCDKVSRYGIGWLKMFIFSRLRSLLNQGESLQKEAAQTSRSLNPYLSLLGPNKDQGLQRDFLNFFIEIEELQKKNSHLKELYDRHEKDLLNQKKWLSRQENEVFFHWSPLKSYPPLKRDAL
jgi:hypothetical protein